MSGSSSRTGTGKGEGAHRAVRHGELTLALHVLREAPGLPLLLLHEVAGASRLDHPAADQWPGAVLALDFSGHGTSPWRGGAYSPEVFVADTDAALAEIGAAALCGEGLGAWVAFLSASARPDLVPAALLCPGRGLAGGGERPARLSQSAVMALRIEQAGRRAIAADAGENRAGGCGRADPLVALCEHDARPTEYVAELAPAARRLLLWEDGEPRPGWWRALADTPPAQRVTNKTWREALAALHAAAAIAGFHARSVKD